MNQTVSFLILCAWMMSSTCTGDKQGHDRISFINNSDKAVYVEGDFSYPDTSLNFFFTPEGNSYAKVLPHTAGSPLPVRDTYENSFQYNEVLMVFVFDAEILETIPWDTVKANYLVLKRYDLTLNDLINQNWEITYP